MSKPTQIDLLQQKELNLTYESTTGKDGRPVVKVTLDLGAEGHTPFIPFVEGARTDHKQLLAGAQREVLKGLNSPGLKIGPLEFENERGDSVTASAGGQVKGFGKVSFEITETNTSKFKTSVLLEDNKVAAAIDAGERQFDKDRKQNDLLRAAAWAQKSEGQTVLGLNADGSYSKYLVTPQAAAKWYNENNYPTARDIEPVPFAPKTKGEPDGKVGSPSADENAVFNLRLSELNRDLGDRKAALSILNTAVDRPDIDLTKPMRGVVAADGAKFGVQGDGPASVVVKADASALSNPDPNQIAAKVAQVTEQQTPRAPTIEIEQMRTTSQPQRSLG